jgi:hypothetical protein
VLAKTYFFEQRTSRNFFGGGEFVFKARDRATDRCDYGDRESAGTGGGCGAVAVPSEFEGPNGLSADES